MGLYYGGVGRAREKRSETQLLNFPATPGAARDVLYPARGRRDTALKKVGGSSLLCPKVATDFW